MGQGLVKEMEYQLSRLGLADVERFGLTWEDCGNYLRCLGYPVIDEFDDSGEHAPWVADSGSS